MKYCFGILLLSLLAGCGINYNIYKKNYHFKSVDGRPHYEDLDYWAAHPYKHDPSDSIPKAIHDEYRDSLVDVFFLHPTTYTAAKKGSNAAIDNATLAAKTDYTSILYQASVFNNQCRVFAPRYRQAHISNFFTKDTAAAARSFDTAYQDLKEAFEYYLQHWNQGRPIIIAGHSQGAMLAERLLKDFFEDKPLQNKLVVAYILGWGIPKNFSSSLFMCKDSLQTGCLCSWRTLKKGFIPKYLKNEKGNAYATNPLNWTTGSLYASRIENKGSILSHFNKLYLHTTDAQIKDGLLFVHRPKFPFSFLYLSRNYHPGDINLFYVNLRENVRQRIGAFWKQ